METLLQDLRYGIRVLLKKPGFTLVAVITLALGIGANTAIFSVVNAVLLRPLPYKDADTIATLWQKDLKTGEKEDGTSPGNFLDWREQNQVFDHMAAAEPYGHSMTGDGEPVSFRSWLVTEDFFQILGANALYGRTFLPEEYKPGNDRVVVISHGLWQRRFGSDSNLVGQKLLLNGQPYTVAGVMPPEFKFPSERDMYAPRVIRESDKQNRGSAYIKVIGRLKPGLTVEHARQDMDGIAARLAQEYPQANTEKGITVLSLPDQIVGHVRPALLLLFGSVSFVLLIACANLASLLLVRASERQKELAIRSALGAARVRLVRQLITESVVLALLGGAGGILLASWGIDLILALSPQNLPRIDEVAVDGVVFGFALGVSLLTAFIFGLAPSVQFTKPDLQETLKEGGRTSSGGAARHRLRNALVVSEIALALMLLVGAGLLVRSFVHLLRVDPGFSVDEALTLEVHVWGRTRTPQMRAAYFEQTLDRLAALPGVEAAGAVSALPFHESSIDIETTFTIEGRPIQQGHEPSTYVTIATEDYFKAMGIPLRGGRFFARFDNQKAPLVVLINETMARRFFPDEDPLGKKITVSFIGESKTREIIGVVGDTRHAGLNSDPRVELFLPHLQEPYGSMTYIVRTAGDAQSMVPAVKEQIWSVNKDQPFATIATMDQLVSKTLAERRFNLLLLCIFAVMALALAAVGIYGLISFSTSQRTHEIGVRLALGAQQGDIFKLVVGQGLALTLAGVVIGLAGAFALTRLMTSLLYGVSATDTVTFVAVSVLLTIVGLVACYVPARKATRVDPMIALRYE